MLGGLINKLQGRQYTAYLHQGQQSPKICDMLLLIFIYIC